MCANRVPPASTTRDEDGEHEHESTTSTSTASTIEHGGAEAMLEVMMMRTTPPSVRTSEG
jgi:hypothetical protein